MEFAGLGIRDRRDHVAPGPPRVVQREQGADVPQRLLAGSRLSDVDLVVPSKAAHLAADLVSELAASPGQVLLPARPVQLDVREGLCGMRNGAQLRGPR